MNYINYIFYKFMAFIVRIFGKTELYLNYKKKSKEYKKKRISYQLKILTNNIEFLMNEYNNEQQKSKKLIEFFKEEKR